MSPSQGAAGTSSPFRRCAPVALNILLFGIGIFLAALTLLDVFETVVVPGGSKASLKVAKRLVSTLLPVWKAVRGKRHGLSSAIGAQRQSAAEVPSCLDLGVAAL